MSESLPAMKIDGGSLTKNEVEIVGYALRLYKRVMERGVIPTTDFGIVKNICERIPNAAADGADTPKPSRRDIASVSSLFDGQPFNLDPSVHIDGKSLNANEAYVVRRAVRLALHW